MRFCVCCRGTRMMFLCCLNELNINVVVLALIDSCSLPFRLGIFYCIEFGTSNTHLVWK